MPGIKDIRGVSTWKLPEQKVDTGTSVALPAHVRHRAEAPSFPHQRRVTRIALQAGTATSGGFLKLFSINKKEKKKSPPK